jgi:hypothetical protein
MSWIRNTLAETDTSALFLLPGAHGLPVLDEGGLGVGVGAEEDGGRTAGPPITAKLYLNVQHFRHVSKELDKEA